MAHLNLKYTIREFIYKQFDDCHIFLTMNDDALRISSTIVEVGMINEEENNFYDMYGDLIEDSDIIYNEIRHIKNELIAQCTINERR